MAETRRVKLTKRMIRDAFIELLRKKPIGKITVTQICEAADVNRSTFYAYYDSVYALLKEIEDTMLQRIPKPAKDFTDANTKEYLEELVVFFEYIKKHHDTFAVLSTDIVKQSFYSKLGYVFSVNGVIGMIKEWIENDFPITSREFADTALQMSMHANEVIYRKE